MRQGRPVFTFSCNVCRQARVYDKRNRSVGDLYRNSYETVASQIRSTFWSNPSWTNHGRETSSFESNLARSSRLSVQNWRTPYTFTKRLSSGHVDLPLGPHRPPSLRSNSYFYATSRCEINFYNTCFRETKTPIPAVTAAKIDTFSEIVLSPWIFHALLTKSRVLFQEVYEEACCQTCPVWDGDRP